MRKCLLTVIAALLPALAVAAAAEDGPILSSEGAQRAYDEGYFYAEAYRAGDYIFVSGKLVGAWDGEPIGIDGFKEDTRRVFRDLKRALEAGGSGLEDIVMIRSFHIFDSPLFDGTKQDQIAAFQQVKVEFVPKPHPAQTSVGVRELLPDLGFVEVEVVAYAPLD